MPSVCYAWGPLTHFYLGNELVSFSSLLPATVYYVIKRFREDFLYGNIIPDIVFGKKYLSPDKNSHTWEFGFNLLNEAKHCQQKALVYGYLSHLAADTVAHEILTKEKKSFGHTYLEYKADGIIRKKYWAQVLAIKRDVQRRNDIFLENSINRMFFSYKTNKRIFKSLIFLSLFASGRASSLIEKSLYITSLPEKKDITRLTEESLFRIIDLIEKGPDSYVAKKNPSGELVHGRIFRSLFLNSDNSLRRPLRNRKVKTYL